MWECFLQVCAVGRFDSLANVVRQTLNFRFTQRRCMWSAQFLNGICVNGSTLVVPLHFHLQIVVFTFIVGVLSHLFEIEMKASIRIDKIIDSEDFSRILTWTTSSGKLANLAT